MNFSRKTIVSTLIIMVLIYSGQGMSYAQDDYIEGPYLWMIAPGGSINVDNLSEASDGVVTESEIALNGVSEGHPFNDLQWTSGRLLPTTVCGIFLCSSDNVINVVRAIGLTNAHQLTPYSAYALLDIYSPEARNNVSMGVGSDDSVKVWLNGEVVHTNPVRRRTTGIQDRFLVDLNAGKNLLMVKVCNNGSGGNDDWGLFVKLYLDNDEFTISLPNLPLSASVVSPLTEATLDASTVSLTLTDTTYEPDIAKIRDAVSVSGIRGVTIDTATVQRLSDTEITVELAFDGTDFDTNRTLTFSVAAGAITDYIGDDFTTIVPVTGVEEGVSASVVVSPLAEATLNENVVSLTLTGLIYEPEVLKIREGVTVSGISGVTLDTPTVQRLSDREITVELTFDGTDFDTDGTLTFSVAAGAIAGYTGSDFTAEISVTAHQESVSASVVSPLTEATLDEGIVSLTLTDATYEPDIAKIRGGVSVSGLDGVSVNTATVRRLSGTEITVELTFDGTDFDTDGTLTFSVAAGAIANYRADALTTEISVAPNIETLLASVVSPLTEATLDGGIVSLILRGATYKPDIAKIRGAVSVSGLDGVSVNTATVRRLSGTEITVALTFDGTDFNRDSTLTFSVASGALRNDKITTLTTEVPVLASRAKGELSVFWTNYGRGKIQRANLDGSNVEDIVTQGLENPAGIALDVVGGKIYWTDANKDIIQRANLDGSNVEDLVTRGLRDPTDIALDVTGGKMYWTDRYTNKIQRANLDGSNVEDLVIQRQTTFGGPRGIALDVLGGKMYWTDDQTRKIQRANLDGSNVEDLVTQGLRDPAGIALDVADVLGGKMYWTDTGTGKIQRANLDGSQVEDLVPKRFRSDPQGIALDVVGGKIYWTDSRETKIQRANLDGSNVRDFITQGLTHPYGIAIGVIPPVNPATTAKADVNGDGIVDVQDLVSVAQQYGKTGTNAADVNGDGVVNVDDFILVAAAVDAAAAAAPATRAQVESHFTAAQLQEWLTEARASGNTYRTYQRGIAVLERLLALIAPEETALLANFPNPFNPETWIPYRLATPGDVTLTIYGVNGQVVRTLSLGHQVAGFYTARDRAAYWDGKNAVGESVASGVYFYTLTAGEFTATRKLLILK